MAADNSSPNTVILVVDEERQFRTAVCENLVENGFSTIEAEDSDAAVDLLRNRADIRGAVIDAHVPGALESVDLIRLVRRDWPRIAVVMISGHSDSASGPLPDGTEFLNKPNLGEELAPLLRRLIGENRSSA